MDRFVPPRAAVLVLALLACCSEPRVPEASALAELERLSFVPPGTAVFRARRGPPILCSNDIALLVDRFEVPRGEWRRYGIARSAAGGPTLSESVSTWVDESDMWPATWMTRDEGREYARSRGMRLPTAVEWLRMAAGTGAQPFPWGPGRASRVANTLELQLGRPVAVGTFELGQTPLATYDMCGNVWEWVDDPLPAGTGGESDGSALAWVLGGSYGTPLRRIWDYDGDGRIEFDHLDLDPRTRSEDVGLRCVAPAADYLRANARRLGDGVEVRSRLLAVGRSWGRDALPVLEELAAARGAPIGLSWLAEGARR